MGTLISFKFIPRGLPRDKAMGDCQGGEAELIPLDRATWFIPRGESKFDYIG